MFIVVPFCQRASVLAEPQAHGVPRAAEEARERHVLERDQREVGNRLAVQRDLDGADALRARDRRDQRFVRLHRQRELVGLALRDRQVAVGEEARGHLEARALPDAQRGHLPIRFAE